VQQPVRFLEIEPTTRCNFTCGFCCGRHMVQQDLDPAAFEAALDAFPGVEHLELQGEGEPLLHPRFFELVELARSRGIRVSCITNGSLLSAENVARLLDLGLEKLMVSFESLEPAAFRRLRGGKIEKVIDGLERLASERRARSLERPSIGLAVTVLRDTLDELPAFVALYRRLGLDGGINLQPLNPMPGYRRHYDAWLSGQLLTDGELRRQMERWRAEPVHGIAMDGTSPYRGFFDELFHGFESGARLCPWLERGAFVTADGSVTPCCTIKDGERAGFGKLGPGTAAQNDAARRALADELAAGRTPAACEGCAIAALAVSGTSDGQRAAVDALLALELEFSWVHASWLALQRDIRTRLAPALTDAVVRREALPAPGGAAVPDAPDAIDSLEGRLASAEGERSRLATELAAARARVEALLASKSWRLSAPLRAVDQLLRRLG
jgi:MoaA/NifB/PqqE/SkfB family radical SAM enzyme